MAFTCVSGTHWQKLGYLRQQLQAVSRRCPSYYIFNCLSSVNYFCTCGLYLKSSTFPWFICHLGTWDIFSMFCYKILSCIQDLRWNYEDHQLHQVGTRLALRQHQLGPLHSSSGWLGAIFLGLFFFQISEAKKLLIAWFVEKKFLDEAIYRHKKTVQLHLGAPISHVCMSIVRASPAWVRRHFVPVDILSHFQGRKCGWDKMSLGQHVS